MNLMNALLSELPADGSEEASPRAARTREVKIGNEVTKETPLMGLKNVGAGFGPQALKKIADHFASRYGKDAWLFTCGNFGALSSETVRTKVKGVTEERLSLLHVAIVDRFPPAEPDEDMPAVAAGLSPIQALQMDTSASHTLELVAAPPGLHSLRSHLRLQPAPPACASSLRLQPAPPACASSLRL